MRYNFRKHIKIISLIDLIFVIFITVYFYVPHNFLDEYPQTANTAREMPVKEKEERNETRERKNIRSQVLLTKDIILMPLLCKIFLTNSQRPKRTILFLRE